MQELLWSFFSSSENHGTLPISAQYYLKYCIFAIATLFHVFRKQKYMKNLARSKFFDSPYLSNDIAGSYSLTSYLKILNKRH